MYEQVIWGIVLIAHIVPWAAWIFNRHQTIETRRKLYPGRADEDRQDANTTRTGLLLTAGLAFLLVAWNLGWHPIPSALLVAAAAAAFVLSKRALTRLLGTRSRTARFWIACTAFWLLCVCAWFLVFRHDSSLDDLQFVLIAILPPSLAAAGVCLYAWASSSARSSR